MGRFASGYIVPLGGAAGATRGLSLESAGGGSDPWGAVPGFFWPKDGCHKVPRNKPSTKATATLINCRDCMKSALR
jgi:hypothetical protein